MSAASQYARTAWDRAFRTRRGLVVAGVFAGFSLLVACGSSFYYFATSPFESSATLFVRYLLICAVSGAAASYGAAFVLTLLSKARRP